MHLQIRPKTVSTLIQVLLASFLLIAAGPKQVSEWEWEEVPRVVAMGDVHGNLDKLTAILQGTGVVNDRLRWTGGSDHVSFLCAGAPGFRLQSNYPDYRQYTWHTNRDTYDKVVFDDLKNNATLAAMLIYLASEDPEKVSRERSVLPPTPQGQPREWLQCRPARRSWN